MHPVRQRTSGNSRVAAGPAPTMAGLGHSPGAAGSRVTEKGQGHEVAGPLTHRVAGPLAHKGAGPPGHRVAGPARAAVSRCSSARNLGGGGEWASPAPHHIVFGSKPSPYYLLISLLCPPASLLPISLILSVTSPLSRPPSGGRLPLPQPPSTRRTTCCWPSSIRSWGCEVTCRRSASCSSTRVPCSQGLANIAAGSISGQKPLLPPTGPAG